MSQSFSKHIPILDGIRAYAVLLVCLIHFFQVDEAGLYESNKFLGVFFFKASQSGLRGVELFFVLSGFLITGILLDTKRSPKYFTTFYSRRFLRIFPLYYCVLFISFLILPYLIQVDAAGKEVIEKQVWLWTYTSNLTGGWDASLNFPSFGHFWSLCVEEHFYIFWPLLVYLTSDKWLPRIMWGLVIVSALSVLIVYFTGDLIPILKWSTIRCSGVLSLGGLIARSWRRPSEFKRIAFYAQKFVWYTGFLFLLFNFIPRKYEIQDISTFFSSVLFFALVLIVSLNGNRVTDKLFNHKPLYYIGKISYGIYVYHGMLRPFFKNYIYGGLHSFVKDGILASLTYTIICTLISIFIAVISWNLFEFQILKLKRRINY
jgi:peptidoglycan/LPS O-acetylase OafA/YrhL